jgi:hypothetical protein
MIKFFRKIRQKMLTENKFSMYLLYAVGEVILVVIGILIALQINNANELNKQNKQEQNYLIALKDEFNYNQSMLEKVIRKNTRCADASFELLKHTGPGEPQLSEIEFSKLLMGAVFSEVKYLPSSGVLEEIISSGKLDIFQNKELINHMSSWSGVMEKVRFQETELTKFRIALIDLSLESGNSRQLVIDSRGNLFGLTNSKFKNVNRHLLNSVKFENAMTVFLISSRITNQNYYSDLEEKIKAILLIIETEIK